MAKVVVGKFANSKIAARATAVVSKRVRDAKSGSFLTVRKIDVQSETLGDDLNFVFSKNVAKARRDNKAVAGVVDRVPAKA